MPKFSPLMHGTYHFTTICLPVVAAIKEAATTEEATVIIGAIGVIKETTAAEETAIGTIGTVRAVRTTKETAVGIIRAI